MYIARSHVRATILPRTTRCLAAKQQLRTRVTLRLDQTKAYNETSEYLAKSGVWGPVRRTKKSTGADRYRVNVVSEKLCNDIIDYIRPTLARHEGCDILDIFPGAGIWSTALHDAVKPRSHLLLEPDAKFYEPVLKPLLERPGTKILENSGIVWDELVPVLTPAHLPHQVERKPSPDQVPERNDTLLVTINLSMYPKRRFGKFDSLAQLVLFQMLASIRPGSLFQKYGLVRMLIWTSDPDKTTVLPRNLQRRNRTAVETELATDWTCEIAGADIEDSGDWFRRDKNIDLESVGLALRRMEQLGIKTPPGRASQLMREYLELEEPPVAGGKAPRVHDRYFAELEALERDAAAGLLKPGSAEAKRLTNLRYWIRSTHLRFERAHDVLREYNNVMKAYREAGSDPERLAVAASLAQAWNDRMKSLDKAVQRECFLHIDNVSILHQDPPILNWDRRYAEPLVVDKDEFFPNVPCALLDVQPKAAARVLREIGPRSTHAGDAADLIFRSLFSNSTTPISNALESINPGARNGVLEHCPSITDPMAGGSPIGGLGELPTRRLNQRHLVEIMEGWMKWPFRPEFSELVTRTSEDYMDEDLDGDSPVTKTLPTGV